MDKQEVAFAVEIADGVISRVGRFYVTVPGIQFQGGGIKWLPDRHKMPEHGKETDGMTEERLFECACSGETDDLEAHLKSGGSLDVAYEKFERENSLLMGAFRNRQWDTVMWLLGNGAGLTGTEQDEVNGRYMEMFFINRMQKVHVQ